MYEWLKAILPFGRSADFWGNANTVRTASVTFPLTPALSLGERENPARFFSKAQRGVCPTNRPNNRTCRRLFPLPVGEGQGEGNRVDGLQNPPRHRACHIRSGPASFQH